MTKTPIEMMFDGIEWTAQDGQSEGDAIPYATHFGILKIGDCELRCYRLSSGQTVIHADDLDAFIQGLSE